MRCAECGAVSDPGSSPRYCAACGALLPGSTSRGAVWAALRVVGPLLALAGSFLPWLTVGVVTRTRHWDAYQVGAFAWLWLVLDLAALLLAIGSARRGIGRWLRIGYGLLGALSLGVGISAVVLVQVSERVSGILGAPNPLSLSSGLVVFDLASLWWCAASFAPWQPRLATGRTRSELTDDASL